MLTDSSVPRGTLTVWNCCITLFLDKHPRPSPFTKGKYPVPSTPGVILYFHTILSYLYQLFFFRTLPGRLGNLEIHGAVKKIGCQFFFSHYCPGKVLQLTFIYPIRPSALEVRSSLNSGFQEKICALPCGLNSDMGFLLAW